MSRSGSRRLNGNVLNIKPYECYQTLGEGSFGAVYKAAHESNILALKVVNLQVLRRLNPKFNPYHEYDILKKLKNVSHRHLVRFYGMREETDETILFAMEYCQFGDLKSHLETVRLISEPAAKLIAQQILSGLLQLRDLGIVHRDLKPGNLFLTNISPVTIKIGDFGFAKRLGEAPMTTTLCGSPLYAAPEILGKVELETYDAYKADLWSFGVIVFEMVTGLPPFNGLRPDLQHRAILDTLNSTGITMAGVTPQLQDFVNRLLVVDPERRLDYDAVRTHPWLEVEPYLAAVAADALAPDQHNPDVYDDEDGGKERDYLWLKAWPASQPPPTEESLIATITEVSKSRREVVLKLQEANEKLKMRDDATRAFEERLADQFARIAELEEQLSATVTENCNLKAQVVSLTVTSDEALTHIAELRAGHSDVLRQESVEVARARTQLEVKETELKSLKSEMHMKALELVETRRVFEKQCGVSGSLQRELEACKAELHAQRAFSDNVAANLREQIERLRGDLEATRGARDTGADEVVALRNERATLRTELESVRGALAASQQAVAAAQQATAQLAAAGQAAHQASEDAVTISATALANTLSIPADRPVLDILDAAARRAEQLAQNISYSNFAENDVVLFFPTQQGAWVAFNSNTCFLAQESRLAFETERLVSWYMGRVILIREDGVKRYLVCHKIEVGPPR